MKNKKIKKLLKYSSFAMIAPLVIPLTFSCTSQSLNNNQNIDSTNNDVSVSISSVVSSNDKSNNLIEPIIKINNSDISEANFEYEWLVLNNNNWQKIDNQTNKNINITQNLLNELNNKQIKLKIIDKTNKNNVWYSNVCLIAINNSNNTPSDVPSDLPNDSQNGNDNSSSSKPTLPDDSNQTPNNPVVDEWGTQGIDWFVQKGKDPNVLANRITIPTTTNQKIIDKYGNAALPWKKDNELTNQDLMNMFSYRALTYVKDIKMSFGQRQIYNNKLADAFVEWNTTIRKYFPYVAESRGNYFFKNRPDMLNGKMVDIDDWSNPEVKSLSDDVFNHDWVVDGTTHPGFSPYTGINNTNWFLENDEQRQIFEQFLWTLISRLQPNMTELDKFMVAYDCVENWLREGVDSWGTDDVLSTNMGINSKHQGVCTTFGGLFSFALNVVGIKAVGVQTDNYGNPSHWNTWVYLDITGNDKEQNRKWYQSDPMWSINLMQDGLFLGNSAVTKNLLIDGDAKRLMLFDPSENRTTLNRTFEHQNFEGRAQFMHNRVANLIWTTPYKNNKVSYGNKTYYTNTPWGLNESKDELRSKYVFIKGHWYYLCKEKNNQINFKKVTYKGFENSASALNVNEELNSYEELILKENSIPLMMQINNKVVFITNNIYGQEKKMIIVNIDESNDGNLFDWNNKQEINLNDAKSNIQNLSLKDLIITNFGYDKSNNQMKLVAKENNKPNKNYEFILDLKDTNFNISSKAQKTSFDIWKTAEEIKIQAGNWAVNNVGFNNYLLDEKQLFYKQIDQIVNESKTSNNINSIYEKLITLYKENKSKASKKVEDILPSKLLNSKYSITKENFEKYGFNFEIEGLTSTIDIPEVHNANKDVLFDIYYKKDESSLNDYNSFKKIVSNATESKFTKKDLPNNSILDIDPTGYYYLELKSKTNPVKTIKTKITHIIQSEDTKTKIDKGNSLLTLTNTRKYFTNYDNDGISYIDGGWWNKNNISLSIDLNNNYNIYNSQIAGATLKLKYINPESKELKVIKEINVPYGSTQTVSENVHLDEINENNHGLYYVELNIKDSNNKTTSTVYSNFVSLFTQKDINNFNIKTWSNLYGYITNKND